jgi:hypothetical protein
MFQGFHQSIPQRKTFREEAVVCFVYLENHGVVSGKDVGETPGRKIAGMKTPVSEKIIFPDKERYDEIVEVLIK